MPSRRYALANPLHALAVVIPQRQPDRGLLLGTLTNAARRITAPGATWKVPVSRAALIDVYISGLALAEVAIVGAGRQCRIHTGEIPPGERIKHQFFFRPSHAELLLMTIDKEGVTGKQAAALAALIEQAAAKLGAPYQTPDEVRRAAEEQVDEIVERVKTGGLSGALKKWNTAYRQYRLAQIEKSEPAIPYSAFLEQAVTMPTVNEANRGERADGLRSF